MSNVLVGAPRRHVTRHALPTALAAAAALLVFVSLSRPVVSPVVVIGALLVGLSAAVAQRIPAVVMSAGLVLIAFVPVYWGRLLVGRAIVALPATIVAVVLVPVAWSQLRELRIQTLDVLYGGFVLVQTVAPLINVSHGISSAAANAWRYVFPYVVWRLATLRWLNWATVARVLVATGTGLGLLALAERAMSRNYFFTLVRPGFQAADWAHWRLRLDQIRVEASFGEPITFGLFLGVCVVLAVTLAVTTKRLLTVCVAVGCILVMFAAIVETKSRLALAAALAGSALQLVRLLSREHAIRVFLAAAAAVAAVLLSPLGTEIQSAIASTSGSTIEAHSAQYRLRLLGILTDPSSYSVLGKSSEDATSVSELVHQETGLVSIDDEYARSLTSAGIFGLFTIAGVALSLLRAAIVGREPDVYARAFNTAFAVVCVALTTVALLTQFSDLFGIAIAMIATGRQRRREAAG